MFAIIVAGGCYFLGGFGRISGVAVDASGTPVGGFDSIIPAMLSTLHPILIGLVIILVLSASMSTLSSLAMASSSTVTLDLIKPVVKKDMSDKQQVLVMRSLIVVFVGISAAIAIWQYHSANVFIAQMMGVSWGALAGAFLAPFLYGLYSKKTTKTAVWVSFGVGVGVMLLYLVYFFLPQGAKDVLSIPAMLTSPLNLGALVMVLNLILVPVVSLFTPKADAAQVEQIFACYNKTATVPATSVLVEETPQENKTEE